MNLMMNLVLCGVLAVATIAASLYRKWLEDHCDHYIHLHNDHHDAGIIDSQSSVCKRIDTIDKLKTGLLVATVAYALCIIAIATYTAWSTANTL